MAMMEAAQIAIRCTAIRMRRGDLARCAGLHANTVSNLLGGSSVMSGSLVAATAALLDEELRLRDYLLGIHPLEPAKEAGE